MTPTEREILAKVAAQITAEMGDMAAIISGEMGAPITFSTLGQVLAPTMIFNYYAELAKTFAFDEEKRTGLLNPQVLVTKEPVGVVGAIAPNAGQRAALHRGSQAGAVTGGRLLGGLQARPRGRPLRRLPAGRDLHRVRPAQGRASVVPAGREVSEHLVTHPGTDKIAFTGSGVGGKRIGGLCGERLEALHAGARAG